MNDTTGAGRPLAEPAWQELTVPWPDTDRGWAHTDVAWTPRHELVTGLPEGGALVWFGGDTASRTTKLPIMEAHGLTPTGHPDGSVWLADTGSKLWLDADSPVGYRLDGPGVGQVLRVGADGQVLARLTRPESGPLANVAFQPTSVAPLPDDPDSVWVADGYGANLLHRYGPNGQVERTVSGADTPDGSFDCPHGILIDDRRDRPELYVTDRGRNGLVVLDLDGGYLRTVAAGELRAPSALARCGDLLVVAELDGRLTLLDEQDRVVGRWGDNTPDRERPGWPNRMDGPAMVRCTGLAPGRLNSPHGVTVDGQGRVVVTEWLLGGRLLVATPVGSGRGLPARPAGPAGRPGAPGASR